MKNEFQPIATAEGWQLSNPPIFSLATLRGSMEVFEAAGWMKPLRAKSQRLTGYLQQLIEYEVGEHIEILTPHDPDQRGCQLSLKVRGGLGKQVHAQLIQSGIEVDFREPNVIRAAPVPLYNSFVDVFDCVAALKQSLSAPMKKPEHIVIAGAGLVGTLMATMLTQRGYRVSVYEKRPDLRTTAIPAGRSINLALAERGMYALRIAQLMDQVSPLLIPMRGRLIHEVDGRTEFLPYGQRPNEVIYSVSRGELNKLMMNAMDQDPESTLHFNCELVSVDFAQRQLTIQHKPSGDEESVGFDYFLAADGGGSVARRLLLQQTGGSDKSELLDHDYKELHIGPDENGDFQLFREALHIWPRGGFMLIALPNLDASFTVTLFLPKRGPTSFQQLKCPADVVGFFREYFPDALALIPNLAEDFFAHPTGELGTVRCWPWIVNNRAMLIGDAAHAVVPFHGQGMNAGFEDCAEFARLLDGSNQDWPAAMSEFQQIRKPNADAIADMALENYVVMRDSVLDPKFALKKAVGFELERMFPRRFIPRYSMVMFHRIPYRLAYQRGAIQERILDELVSNIESASQLNRPRAGKLITAQLSELSDIDVVTADAI